MRRFRLAALFGAALLTGLTLPAGLSAQTGETTAPSPSAPVPVIEVERPRMLDAEETEPCPVALPDWAWPAERWAWERICKGTVADMRLAGGADDGAGCEARDRAQVWPETRRIRARVVKLIAARAPYVNTMAAPDVWISCAEITGPLNLNFETVPGRLFLDRSRFDADISMMNTVFGSDVVLAGVSLKNGGGPMGGTLWAEDVVVGDDLFLRDGDYGYVKLVGARIGGSLELGGSVISGLYEDVEGRPSGLQAYAINVRDNLLIQGATRFDQIALNSAVIGGNLTLSGLAVAGRGDLGAMRIGGSLTMAAGTQLGDLNLIASQIGQDLTANGLRLVKSPEPEAAPVPAEAEEGAVLAGAAKAEDPVAETAPPRLTGTFQGDRITVGGSVFLIDAAVDGPLVLREAKIGNTVELDRIRLGGPFQALGIAVDGNFWLRGGAQVGELEMNGAQIAGEVQMQGSTFNGKAVFNNARLGKLQLSDASQDVIWGAQASLDLGNADIGVLQSRIPENWQLPDGSPLPRRLDNLRYDRLGPAPPPGTPEVFPKLDAASLIAWVREAVRAQEAAKQARQASEATAVEARFVPQPFRQLEQTLRAMGADDQADEVRVAGHVTRMQAHESTLGGRIAYVGDTIWRWLVGFGAYPFRVLWWFAALVALGVAVARFNGALCARGWTNCFWYSLENALPLVSPSEDHQKVVHERPILRNFFHFQKVAGFVLATILVGALTLLGG